MAYKKKVHRFADCGSNMGAADRSDGSLTTDFRQTTCGVCKRRITEAIAELDWGSELPLQLQAILSSVASHLETQSEPRRGQKRVKVTL